MPALPSLSAAAPLLALGLCLTGCTAPRSLALEPLVVLAEPEHAYAASLAHPAEAWERLRSAGITGHHRLAFGDSGPGAQGTLQRGVEALSPEEASLLLDVRCTLLELDPSEAASFLGWSPGAPWVQTVARGPLEQRLQALGEQRPHRAGVAHRVAVSVLQPGHVARIGQRAYLSSFDVLCDQGLVMADPVIGVLQQGLSLELEAHLDAQAGPLLSVSLATGKLQTPLTDSAARLPSGAKLSVQQPLLLAQGLATRAPADAEQALVLVTLGSGDSDELLFTIVTARPYATPVTAQAPEPLGSVQEAR